jgi:hypothetical protein
MVAGRSGNWYDFGSTSINRNFAVGSPGSSWTDRSCAAWLIGGLVGNPTGSDFAGIGVVLNDGAAYDLSGYSGLTIKIESGQTVDVLLKTSDGGYFEAPLASTTGSQFRTVSFSSLAARADSATAVLNRALVTDIQFTIPADEQAGFGFAIHLLQLVR